MIPLHPIGIVKNARPAVADDHWGGLISAIELDAALGEDALLGIEDFSHAEVIFYFDRVEAENIETGARHPRGNPNWPKVGILAQRGKDRPNRLGLTIVKIVKRTGRTLFVEGLDAVEGTPVLDIKPVMKEFLPRDEVRQPDWATELMRNYW